MSRCFQNVMCFLKLIIRKNFVLKQLISLQRHSGKLIESISTIVQTYIHTKNRCIRGVYKLITDGNWKQFAIVCSLCLLDLKKNEAYFGSGSNGLSGFQPRQGKLLRGLPRYRGGCLGRRRRLQCFP